jgi:hypothetical protein
VKKSSLLLLAVGVAGAGAIHRFTHGVWFPRGAHEWPAPARARRDAWTAFNPIPAAGPIAGVWGERPNDVWAWAQRAIIHWDGQRWSRVAPPKPGAEIDAVGGLPGGGVWARLRQYNMIRAVGCDLVPSSISLEPYRRAGDGWTAFSGPDTLPRAATGVEARANLGRNDVARLKAARGPSLPADLVLDHGWRIGDSGELWAVDAAGRWLAHFDGRRWTAGANPIPGGLVALWLAAEDDGWAVAGDDIFHWDGAAWTLARTARAPLYALWASAPDDVWAVGQDGLVLRWDGRRWTETRVAVGPTLQLIAGRARDDVWAVGYLPGGSFFHWDGARWEHLPNPPPDERGDAVAGPVAITPDGDGRALVVFGQRVFSRTPLGWFELAGPLARTGDALVGAGSIFAFGDDGAGRLWAAGNQGDGDGTCCSPLVLRRSGKTWTKSVAPAVHGDVRAIWTHGPDEAWAVGTNGLILHFDGHAWTREPSGTDETLVAVHGAGHTVWAAGGEGTLLQRRF